MNRERGYQNPPEKSTHEIEKLLKKNDLEFPAKKPPFFEKMRQLPKSIQALLFASFLATSAFALEAGRRLMAAPEETGIKTSESADAETPKKPEGVICAGKTCFFVHGTEETQEKTRQDAKSTLKFLVQGPDASGQLPEELR